MIKTDGLSHIQLTVRDLERSHRFYAQLLGMSELRRGKHSVQLRTPGSREIITLNQSPDQADLSGQMGGIAHFGFRMKDPMDLPLLLEEIARCGGTAHEHGERGGNEVYAFFRDPDGYEVELFWAAD